MRKIIASLVLLICITGHSVAQQLSAEYIEQCNDFLKYLIPADLHHVNDIYIWSPPISVSDRLFLESSELDSTKPWVCYEQAPCGSAPKNTDTIRLTSKDMSCLRKHFSAKHDTAWINKLASATGLLTGQPQVITGVDAHHELLSAPLFLQHNTVCIVYRETSDSYGRGGGYMVYKKDKRGWVFIVDMFSFIEN